MTRDWFFARMFHRRLALLTVIGFAVTLLLGAQLVRLTVVKGAEKRAVAEGRLEQRSYLATQRGRVLDREGRVLAKDAPAVHIAVDYSVITGAWAHERAFKAARVRAGTDRWDEMSPEARAAAYDAELPAFEGQIDRVWREIRAEGRLSSAELDAILNNITREVRLMAEETWREQRAVAWQKYGVPESEEDDPFEERPIREQTMPHVILRDVSEDVAFHFRRLESDLPGIHVIESGVREYPALSRFVELDRSALPEPLRSDVPAVLEVQGLCDHMLGGMREHVWAEDVARMPFDSRDANGRKVIDLQGYRPGDHVGHAGIERVYERWLRGHRGIVDHHLDTGQTDRVEPQFGRDLTLTIDLDLQAAVQGIMSPDFGLMRVQQYQAGWDAEHEPREAQLPLGTPLYGAAVVLDVDSAEILALVSTPTNVEARDWTEEDRTFMQPSVNRAIEKPYPPGSIVKPLVLTAAVTEGAHRLSEGIECTGHYFPHWRERARCWIYREHYNFTTHSVEYGPLDAAHAIAVSCNIYFYTLAEKLGASKLVEWYRRFGLGRYLHSGLSYVRPDSEDPERTVVVGEYPGEHPSEAHLANGISAFDEVILGIGQGQLAWTPLHAANAYATLARYGAVRDPTVIRSGPDATRIHEIDDLGLDQRAVEAALDGLRQSVEENFGTGRKIKYEDGHEEPIINAENVIVWAKTGTAQAPAIVLDKGTDHERVLRFDHAWWVGLVGSAADGRPRHAIAVLVEYGGSGGRTAGPVANQIIHALGTRGYLD